jgi:RNA polymerase sigma factor (sigma-70 family)
MRGVRAGDERSFEAIFKRHHAPLLSYCRHMLGSRDEGEDALQQAFIKAHRALLGGSAPRELRPWLYAIARNCCLSAIAARRTTVQLEDRMPALAGLSEEVHRREDLRELLAGIGRLPEDQRSALLLAELEDLPHRTIATIVGCEVSKVKALIYQARSSLIADRNAREASCRDIREELSVARGGELRRGPLRRHLKLCEGCRDFQLAVSAQRESFAAVLPVLPSAGLLVAILGHGAAHGIGAAGLAGTGGLASAGGTGAAATATGAGGVGGLTATGTTVGAGSTVGASTAVGASAAGGGTTIGALIGGGLATKLAVGGAVLAMAAVGGVTAHNREASAISRRATPARLVVVGAAGRGKRDDIAYVSANPSSSYAQGSLTALELANAAASSVGVESLIELSVLGGASPPMSPAGTLASGAATAGDTGQLAGASGQGRSGAASNSRRAAHANEIRARRRAALRSRRALLRRKEARLRRLRTAKLRAKRKALHRKHPPAKPPGKLPIKPTVKPLLAPTPALARPPRRKARPALTPTTRATTPTTIAPTLNGRTTTEGAKGDANKKHRRSSDTTGVGASSTATNTTTTTTETTGTGTGSAGSKTGKGKAHEPNPTQETGAGKKRESGSGKEAESGGSPTTPGSGAGIEATPRTYLVESQEKIATPLIGRALR